VTPTTKTVSLFTAREREAIKAKALRMRAKTPRVRAVKRAKRSRR